MSIADKRASEEDFLVHLEAGRVLHIGQWVRFADAKTPPVAPVSASPDNGYPPETVVVGFSPAAAPGRPEAISREASEEEETSIGQYPPETKAIQIQPPVPGTEGANSDAVSSYTMETGLFVIDRSIEVAETQGLESETKPAMAVQSTGSTAPAGKKNRGRAPARSPFHTDLGKGRNPAEEAYAHYRRDYRRGYRNCRYRRARAAGFTLAAT